MTELPNRGVFVDKNIYQLYATTMPAVLLEMGYLSNPTDLKLLTTEPQSFASGIYYGILYYYGLI
jgi:N-acetylmuramoyl-L-alanine amidase